VHHEEQVASDPIDHVFFFIEKPKSGILEKNSKILSAKNL